MQERLRPGVEMKLLDMRPDGSFVPQRPPAIPTWPLRLGIGAAIVAVIATGLAAATILFWLATLLIPVAILAGLVALAAFRFQSWRTRR